jgi:hypothetical protein
MPNGAQIHLAAVHFPIAATVLGVLVLVLAELLRFRALFQCGWILLIAGALGAGAAYWSGEGAEDVLGEYAAAHEAEVGDAMERVEPHEESAGWALGFAAGAAVAGAGMLFLTRRAPVAPPAASSTRAPAPGDPVLRIAVVALGAAAVFFVGRSASLGGDIRHPELQPGSAASAPK